MGVNTFSLDVAVQTEGRMAFCARTGIQQSNTAVWNSGSKPLSKLWDPWSNNQMYSFPNLFQITCVMLKSKALKTLRVCYLPFYCFFYPVSFKAMVMSWAKHCLWTFFFGWPVKAYIGSNLTKHWFILFSHKRPSIPDILLLWPNCHFNRIRLEHGRHDSIGHGCRAMTSASNAPYSLYWFLTQTLCLPPAPLRRLH